MAYPSRTWILYDSLYKTQSTALSTENAQMAIFKMTERDTVRFFIWTTGWEKWQPLKAYLESNQRHFVSSLSTISEELAPTPENKENVSQADLLQMKPTDKDFEDEVTASLHGFTITKTFAAISLEEVDLDAQDEKAIAVDFDANNFSSHPEVGQKSNIDFKKLNKKTLKERQDRHDLQIEILLISSLGKTFRSLSKNISMSGSLLEDNIPFDYHGRRFDVVVINKQVCEPQFQRVSLKGQTVGEGLTSRIHFSMMTPTMKKALQNLLENYLATRKKLKKTG